MSFNERTTMENSAASIMAASSMTKAFQDILIGTPTTAAVHASLSRYCSDRLRWSLHGVIYDLDSLVFYVLSTRIRFVSIDIEVTHIVREGNTSSTRDVMVFTRQDGSTVVLENSTFIARGEDGLWDDVVQMARIVDDSRKQTRIARRASEDLSIRPSAEIIGPRDIVRL